MSIHSFESAFAAFNQKHHLFAKDQTLLLACSGGVDSVVLGHLLHKAAHPFAVAHCNFKLRGTESERDEAFVRQLATEWNVPLHVQQFDTSTFATQNKLSIQVAARQLRYDWFAQLIAQRKEEGQSLTLVTAHHGNDNAETVLNNLFRGTGIEGMHGILPKRKDIVRPLLFTTKDELLEYAIQENLSWVDDSSNDSLKYTRNFIRHEIIPATTKLYPNAVQNMMATIERLSEAELLYNQAVALHKKKLLELNGNEWRIAVRKLLQAVPLRTILFELISPFGFTEGQIGEVLRLCESDSGAWVGASQWRIIRHRNWLVIAPVQQQAAQTVLIDQPGSVTFTGGSMFVAVEEHGSLEEARKLGAEEVLLDARHIRFPLVLRPWKAGDYFYPLGMPKKKKIARFLIDQKLSKTDKEKVWVVECNKKIVWLAGLRIDDRFKVLPSTTSFLRIKLS